MNWQKVKDWLLSTDQSHNMRSSFAEFAVVVFIIAVALWMTGESFARLVLAARAWLAGR